ncbi:MAG: uncharacterized protein A8A55_0819 [Amphiamblys sp. WSBS2006]|nr:MAG: uncharacterized protein A8A55_0819 [Amphiamblys sp. WSBS2006]
MSLRAFEGGLLWKRDRELRLVDGALESRVLFGANGGITAWCCDGERVFVVSGEKRLCVLAGGDVVLECETERRVVFLVAAGCWLFAGLISGDVFRYDKRLENRKRCYGHFVAPSCAAAIDGLLFTADVLGRVFCYHMQKETLHYVLLEHSESVFFLGAVGTGLVSVSGKKVVLWNAEKIAEGNRKYNTQAVVRRELETEGRIEAARTDGNRLWCFSDTEAFYLDTPHGEAQTCTGLSGKGEVTGMAAWNGRTFFAAGNTLWEIKEKGVGFEALERVLEK